MPECQKIKNGELDQYGAERFGRLILPQSERNVGMKGLIFYWCHQERLLVEFCCLKLMAASRVCGP